MASLMFVAAHPDDDTFGVAGLVALHSDDPDLRFILVHATYGEAGEIASDSGVTREQLADARRIEDETSWRIIGRQPDRHVWLGLPDGELADLPMDDLVESVARIMAVERPDVVATFGPDGITGHPDHVTIGAAATRAFARFAGETPGFRRLIHCAIPQSEIDTWNEERRNAGLWEWDPSQPFHLRGVPDDRIDIIVDTSRVADKLVAAIRSHRTQWSYQAMPTGDHVLARSLQREFWVIGWPPRPSGSDILDDVFAAL